MTQFIKHVLAKKKGSKGELYLYGDIGESFWSEGITDKSVVAELKKLKEEKVTSLDVYINSVGGSVFHGMAVYNALKRFGKPVCVYIDGIAASIASIIAMAGSDIIMGRGSMMMIHEPSVFKGGKADDHKETAAMLEKIRDEMVAIYAERTQNPEVQIKTWMSAETWMTSADALLNRFATKVSATSDEEAEMRAVASASPLLAGYRNIPDELRMMIARGSTQPPAAPARSKENEMDLKILASLLGLPADATEKQVADAIVVLSAKAQLADTASAKSSELSDVLAVAGKTSAAEAKGVFLAWKSSHEQVATLQMEKQKIEAERYTARVKEVVEGAIREGKITPAMKDYWMAQGTKSLEMLESYVAQAPRAVADPIAPKAQETSVALPLSAEQQDQMFKAAGIHDPELRKKVLEKVQAERAALAASGVRLQ